MTQEEQIRLYRLMEMVIYFDLNQEFSVLPMRAERD